MNRNLGSRRNQILVVGAILACLVGILLLLYRGRNNSPQLSPIPSVENELQAPLESSSEELFPKDATTALEDPKDDVGTSTSKDPVRELNNAVRDFTIASAAKEKTKDYRSRISALIRLYGTDPLIQMIVESRDMQVRRWGLWFLYCVETGSLKKSDQLRTYHNDGSVVISDPRFIKVMESLVLDSRVHSHLRAMAISGIVLLPQNDMERMFRVLLSQPGAAPGAAFGALTNVQETETFPSDLINLAEQRALEVYGDLASGEGNRRSAFKFLERYPEHIVGFMQNIDDEPSNIIRLSVLVACSEIVTKDPLHEAAPLVIPKLIAQIKQHEGSWASFSIIWDLGNPTLKDKYGTEIENALSDIAVGSSKQELRVQAMWAIERAKYTGATDVLRSLADDPSEKIREAAESAIRILSQ